MRSMLVLALGLAGCDLVFELREPPGACTGEACLDRLVEGEDAPTELAVDGDELFWLTRTAVRACAIETCEPRTLADNQVGHHGLLIDGDGVLWAEDNVMRWVRRDGGGPINEWRDDSFSRVESFVRFGTRIWWSSKVHGMTRCNYDPDDGTCTSPSGVGGLGDVTGTLAVGGNRMWGSSDDAVVDVDDDQGIVVTSFPVTAPQLLAIGTSHVFATSGSQVFASLVTAKSGTPPLPILTTPVPITLLVTSEHVYVGDAGGTILRLPLLDLDATAEMVAAELPGLRDIAVARDRVFVISGDGIASFPEP